MLKELLRCRRLSMETIFGKIQVGTLFSFWYKQGDNFKQGFMKKLTETKARGVTFTNPLLKSCDIKTEEFEFGLDDPVKETNNG
jgi:hypothetical protein